MKLVIEEDRPPLNEATRASKARKRIDKLFYLQRDMRWEVIHKIPGRVGAGEWTKRAIAVLDDFFYDSVRTKASPEKLEKVVRWMGARSAAKVMTVPILFVYPKTLKRMPIMYLNKKRWKSQRFYLMAVQRLANRPGAAGLAVPPTSYTSSTATLDPAIWWTYEREGYILVDPTSALPVKRALVHELYHAIDSATTVKDLKNFLKKINFASASLIDRAFVNHRADASTKWIMNYRVLRQLAPPPPSVTARVASRPLRQSIDTRALKWEDLPWEHFGEFSAINLEIQRRYNVSAVSVEHMYSFCKGEGSSSQMRLPLCKKVHAIERTMRRDPDLLQAFSDLSRCQYVLRGDPGDPDSGYHTCSPEKLKTYEKKFKKLRRPYVLGVSRELRRLSQLMNRIAKMDLRRPTQRPKV